MARPRLRRAAFLGALGIAAAGCASASAGADLRWMGEFADPSPALPALPEADAGPLSLVHPGVPEVEALAPAAVRPEEGRTGQLPTVEVVGEVVTEDTLVGANRQPEWTTRRPFVRSRVYVLSPWQVELETWSRARYEDGDEQDRRFQQEISMGLPYRFQVDYYHNFTDAEGAGFEDAGPQLEARWAFAEWGKIPLNPTLYGEYRWDTTGADKYEAKLLLGDSLGPRWHAAGNLIYEQETSGGRETELAISGAMSYSLIDRRLTVGAEVTAARVTAAGSRDDPANEIAAGPSLQVRITERIHLDIVPMFGLSDDAKDVDFFIVFGIDLGGGDEKSRLAPISRKSQ